MKNTYRILKTTTLLLFFLSGQLCIAQQKRATLLEDISEQSSKTSFTYFKPELRVDPLTVFEIYKDQFGLNAHDEMRSFRTNEMPVTGIKVSRFHQYHNGYRVMGATMNVHSQDGVALKTNGKLVKNFNNNDNATVAESDALKHALNFIPAKDYAWLDTRMVERIRVKKKDASITLYPTGELVYVQPENKKDFKAEDFIMCWKFDVAMSRSNSQRVFINATTGEVVNHYQLDATCNGTTIHLPYNGDQTVYTSVQNRCTNAGYYEMWDDCNAAYINIEDYDTNDPKCNFVSGNTWTGLSGTTSDAAQVNWGMRTTYQYHLSRFNWTSYDNAGSQLDCFVGYNYLDDNGIETGNNAVYTYWENFLFGYGDNRLNDSDSYSTLDIVAHEFTHGVDDYSADLNYSGESGALDESFADVFGEIVEQATENNWTTPTWQHAEDRTNVDFHRSFIHPKDKYDPDTYLGQYWYTGSDNDKEVHTNSGVQNHFFYLLVEGGNGVNDLGNNYAVTGININDAIDIAWAAHQYLFDAAQYIDSRDAWIEAATDLFGSCSNQAIQVANAWHAVGVGSQSPYYINQVTGTVTAVTSNKTYEAINDVYNVGIVNVNSISGAKEVRFYAGNEVTLNIGFTAPSGCAFKAKINPCSATLHTAPRLSSEIKNELAVTKTDLTNDWFTVFPNPATNKIELLFKENAGAVNSIRLLNAMGSCVQQLKSEANQQANDLSFIYNIDHLATGIYFVEVKTINNTSIKKLVKM